MDRLQELRNLANVQLIPPGPSVTLKHLLHPSADSNVLASIFNASPNPHEELMSRALTLAGAAHRDITIIEAHTKQLTAATKRYKQTISTDTAAGLEEQHRMADEAVSISTRVKTNVEAVKKLLSKPEANGSIKVFVHNQHTTLARRFLTCMREYRTAVDAHEEAVQEQVARQIKLRHRADEATKGPSHYGDAYPENEMTDEQAMEMAQQVLMSGAQDKIFLQSRDVLASVLETREALLEIEQSMRELLYMANDLAALVDEQSLLLDDVLENIRASASYLESGAKQLEEAKETEKKSRRCYWIMAGVGIAIVILIIVLTLVFTV